MTTDRSTRHLPDVTVSAPASAPTGVHASAWRRWAASALDVFVTLALVAGLVLGMHVLEDAMRPGAPSDLVTTAAAVAGCAVILFWEPVTAGLWARTPGHWLAGTALGSSSRLRRFGWELRWALVWSWLAGGAYVILVPDVTILGWAAAVALVPLPVLALWAIRLLGQPISVVEVRASRLRRQQPAPLRTSRLRVTGVAGVVLLTMALAAGCDSAGEPVITTVQTAEQHDPDGTVRAVDWTDRTDRNGRAIDLSRLGSYAVVLYRLVNPTPLAVTIRAAPSLDWDLLPRPQQMDLHALSQLSRPPQGMLAPEIHSLVVPPFAEAWVQVVVHAVPCTVTTSVDGRFSPPWSQEVFGLTALRHTTVTPEPSEVILAPACAR